MLYVWGRNPETHEGSDVHIHSKVHEGSFGCGCCPPRQKRPKPLEELRPDLPAWLGAVLTRAIAYDPAQRFREVTEFAAEMEAGPTRRKLGVGPRTLYERSPVRVWQGIAAFLAFALIASLLLRH